MRKFVITDIHGCRATFNKLLNKLQFSSSDQLFLLGDYIDRGPDSKGVLDDIMQMQEDGHNIECICGNHEQQMLLSRSDPYHRIQWWQWGGKETVESFGFSKSSDIPLIPTKYWDWLNALPVFLEEDKYILVHAGLNFLAKAPLNDYDSILWIRDWYKTIDYDWLQDKIILHGHTPTDKSTIEQQRDNIDKLQYLDLDNGCYKQDGSLCAFEMNSRELSFVKRIDSLNWGK